MNRHQIKQMLRRLYNQANAQAHKVHRQETEAELCRQTSLSFHAFVGGGILPKKIGEQKQTEADNQIFYSQQHTNGLAINISYTAPCTCLHHPTAAHQNMIGVTLSIVPRGESLFNKGGQWTGA